MALGLEGLELKGFRGFGVSGLDCESHGSPLPWLLFKNYALLLNEFPP